MPSGKTPLELTEHPAIYGGEDLRIPVSHDKLEEARGLLEKEWLERYQFISVDFEGHWVSRDYRDHGMGGHASDASSVCSALVSTVIPGNLNPTISNLVSFWHSDTNLRKEVAIFCKRQQASGCRDGILDSGLREARESELDIITLLTLKR